MSSETELENDLRDKTKKNKVTHYAHVRLSDGLYMERNVNMYVIYVFGWGGNGQPLNMSFAPS